MHPIKTFFGFILIAAVSAVSSWSQNVSSMSLSERIGALRSGDPVVRSQAACALGSMGRVAESALPALIELLSDETSVPHDVCRGIGSNYEWDRYNCGRYQPTCPDRTPGELAAHALTDIGGPVREQLEQHLDRESDFARMNSAWTLGAIGSSTSVLPLGRLVLDPSSRVREKLAWALGAIGDRDGVEALGTLINDPDADVRKTASWALGAIGSRRAVDALSIAAQDSNAHVREQAAWALGAIGSREGVAALVPLLNEADLDVLDNAIWALGAIGHSSAVEALIPLLGHEAAEIREQAAWALGAIGDERAVDSLARLMNDDDAEVRKMAMWALSSVY